MLTFQSADVSDSLFQGNQTAVNWGGGFFASQAVAVTSTHFISNASAYAGGGLGVQYGQCRLLGGSFERNVANVTGWGGGVYCGGPSLSISGTQFLSNTALGPGGGALGNTTWLTNTTFINNSAATYGGALQTYGPTQIVNGLIQNNHSQINGGALSTNSSVWVMSSQFVNNTTPGDGTYGGGAIASSQSITAANSHFRGNVANTSPGGALSAGQNLYLDSSDFTGNTAVLGNGGGAFAYGAASLDHVLFSGNQAGSLGGGLALSSTLTISASQLVGNFALSGGGLYQSGGDGRLVNSLFAGNAASSLAGMQLYEATTGTVAILFSTIGAPSLAPGDAIRLSGGSVQI